MEKFIFLVDFIVLAMEEDRDVPIILGRPFLATRRTLIDMEEGKLELCIQEENVTFKVFESITPPFEANSCFRVDVVETNLSTSSPASQATTSWKPQFSKIKARKKEKKIEDDDIKPPCKPLEAPHSPFKQNSISLVFGRKSHYLGDNSPKKGRKKPP